MLCGLKNTIKHVFYRNNSGLETLVIDNNSLKKSRFESNKSANAFNCQIIFVWIRLRSMSQLNSRWHVHLYTWFAKGLSSNEFDRNSVPLSLICYVDSAGPCWFTYLARKSASPLSNYADRAAAFPLCMITFWYRPLTTGGDGINSPTLKPPADSPLKT